MTLGQKLKALRELEGMARGRGRSLSKVEMVTLIRSELDERISLSYLSQLETGRREHMTNRTRLLIARFFRVHPGYLVDDPEEFQQHLATPMPAAADALGAWLHAGAAQFREDPFVADTLAMLADAPDRRKALQLFRQLLARPSLVERLLVTVETRKG